MSIAKTRFNGMVLFVWLRLAVMSKIQASRTPSKPLPTFADGRAPPLVEGRGLAFRFTWNPPLRHFAVWIFCLMIAPPPSHIPHMHLSHPLRVFPNPHPHPSFLFGLLTVILGTYIRLDCFKPLGEPFTFD